MRFEPVATDRDFETPFGRVAADHDAIRLLSSVYGGDLLAGQYDHLREHSVELQVTVLARLLGAGRFKMAGFLLPDACEPTCQANLEKLAGGLARLVAERDGSMLIVAGADLSHIGSRFGDDRAIESVWLKDVAASDEAALSHLESAQPEGFVEHLRRTSNATRVCSSGSLYVLRRALPGAAWQGLGYHQASDPESGTCVTCVAAALWE
jgi:AmmeMemoRadiSam system protein B